MAATGQFSVAARLVKPGGGLSTVSPWLIQTETRPSASGSTPPSSPACLSTTEAPIEKPMVTTCS